MFSQLLSNSSSSQMPRLQVTKERETMRYLPVGPPKRMHTGLYVPKGVSQCFGLFRVHLCFLVRGEGV